MAEPADAWEPESFRLCDEEVERCFAEVDDGTLADIEFAHALGTPEASARIGAVCARQCRVEGFEGHARTADLRVERAGGT
jgi:hypothetical protein